MTDLSLTFRKAANASATGEIPVVLMTVSHESLDEPFRFSSDPTTRISTDPLRYGTVSRGETFDFLPLSIGLPEDSDEATPTIQLVISNLTRQLTPMLRSVATPASVTTEIVLASTPDVVEATWPAFDLVGSSAAGNDVTLTLTVDSLSAEPYPAGQFTPGNFPGLF